MANVAVTSDAWTEISITSGTVQNISATADIELSAEQTDNSGVVLKPSEIYQWDNETIYARAVTEAQGALRVVNFKKAAGGGGAYVLPVASASTLGGVKIGTNLSIDENGVLSAPVSYSTTEQQIGTWIDGKPLYQKTYDTITPNVAGSTKVIDLDASYIVQDISGYIVQTTTGNKLDINFYFSSDFYVATFYVDDPTDPNTIYMNFSSNAVASGIGAAQTIITVKYTKTTD